MEAKLLNLSCFWSPADSVREKTLDFYYAAFLFELWCWGLHVVSWVSPNHDHRWQAGNLNLLGEISRWICLGEIYQLHSDLSWEPTIFLFFAVITHSFRASNFIFFMGYMILEGLGNSPLFPLMDHTAQIFASQWCVLVGEFQNRIRCYQAKHSPATKGDVEDPPKGSGDKANFCQLEKGSFSRSL